MARDGTGRYNLPAGQPVVTNTTISSTIHNTLMADVAAALTTSIASDGQTTPSADLKMGGYKLTNLGTATLSTDAINFGQVQAREFLSSKDYGAIGNGVADDTAAMTGGIAAAVSGGRNLYSVGGTFDVQSLSITGKMTLAGEDKYLTTFVRTANNNAISATSAAKCSFDNFSLNVNRTALGFDGHGIAATQPNTTVRNVAISDFGATGGGGGSGVCMFHSGTSPKLMRIVDSEMSGASGATHSYGWLMENCDTSFASNVYSYYAKNYAHELKNSAYYCALSNLISEYSGTALGYGQDTLSGPCYNVATGIVSKTTDCGYTLGYGNYNLTVGLLHDNTGAPAISGTSHLARYDNSNYNATFATLCRGSMANTVRYGGNYNYTQLASYDTGGTVVAMVAGAAGNATEIAHPGGRTSVRSVISDSSGNSIRGSNANPVWCHATGERIGSISGTFWDKLGASGASPNSNHYWVRESDQYAVVAFATPGNNGDTVGISYAIPASSTQGALEYIRGASNALDNWYVRVGNTDSFRFYSSVFRPESDNTVTLGDGSHRWSVVYAGTGAINTSDGREKQDLAQVSAAEKRAAKTLQNSLRRYRLKSSVQAKGAKARKHFGIVAQDVRDAFAAEGLDASEYGMFCYDEWPDQQEVRDSSGDVIQAAVTAGSRYGVRYDELLCFMMAAT